MNFINKMLYKIKHYYNLLINSIKDIIVSIKNKSFKNIKSKNEKKRKEFIYGIIVLLFVIVVLLGIIGEISNFFPSQEEKKSTNVLIDLVETINSECPECNIKSVNVKKSELFIHKEKKTKLYCYEIEIPNSSLKLDKNLNICIPSQNGDEIDSYLKEQNILDSLQFMLLTHQTMYNGTSVSKYYGKNSLNAGAIQRLFKKQYNKDFDLNKNINNKDDNSETKKDKENKNIENEKSNDTYSEKSEENNDSTVFLTPNKKIISLLTTDELLNKLKSKNKEIIFFVSKDYEDIDNIYDILQQISDNYNITVSYYNIDNISKKEEKEILSLMFSENDFDALSSLEPLLAELNSEYTQYRTLDDTKWTYDFYVSSLINNMFIEM